MKTAYLQVLEVAATTGLPKTIDETSDLSVTVIRALVSEGLLRAIDASSLDGPAFLNPEITLAGREYLRRQASDSQQQEVLARVRSAKGATESLVGIVQRDGKAIKVAREAIRRSTDPSSSSAPPPFEFAESPSPARSWLVRLNKIRARHPNWTVVGAVASVVGVLIAAAFSYWQVHVYYHPNGWPEPSTSAELQSEPGLPDQQLPATPRLERVEDPAQLPVPGESERPLNDDQPKNVIERSRSRASNETGPKLVAATEESLGRAKGGVLTDDGSRSVQIKHYLLEERWDVVIGLLQTIKDPDAADRECLRIVGYALSAKEPAIAGAVAEQCSSLVAREAAIRRIREYVAGQ